MPATYERSRPRSYTRKGDSLDRASIMCLQVYHADGTTTRGCRGWRRCVGPFPWYPPAAISYCRNQIPWLLEHLADIAEGRWPRSPTPEAFVFLHRFKTSASFTAPVEIAAEINIRLAACGEDGDLLRAYYSDGWDIDRLARLMHTTSEKLQRRVSRALLYVTGKTCRRVSYKEFVGRGAARAMRGPSTTSSVSAASGFPTRCWP